MDQEDIDVVLQRMVDVIVREADPDTIILFGSRARGTARADSDVDLLIVEPEPFTRTHSRIDESARLHLALRRFPVSKDLLLYSRDEFDAWKDTPGHVITTARKCGRVLHARC
ncbi:MAG: nucleotidyltransferase domain-containing protein [Betaproteobacteria bacterium]|nr:nucleotidyltransferase domain-containing protein [Betaproteobacteria bacterium]